MEKVLRPQSSLARQITEDMEILDTGWQISNVSNKDTVDSSKAMWFDLTLDNDNISSFPAILQQLQDDGLIGVDSEHQVFLCSGGSARLAVWDEHETYFAELSKKNPNTLFALTITGQFGDAKTRKYFWNGQMQTAQIRWAFEPFDKEKLEIVK